jgi:DNA anti-recombination protein RmuC
MQQISKDARMRQAADLIRTEVGRLMGDVGRLQERVLKLQQHYGQASEDMRQVLISTEKIGTSAGRIDQLDFGDSRMGQGTHEQTHDEVAAAGSRASHPLLVQGQGRKAGETPAVQSLEAGE